MIDLSAEQRAKLLVGAVAFFLSFFFPFIKNMLKRSTDVWKGPIAACHC